MYVNELIINVSSFLFRVFLVVKFSIIVKPYLQFILIFMMIVFAVLVGYFVSIFIVKSFLLSCLN